jgi:hypothetical protein
MKLFTCYGPSLCVRRKYVAKGLAHSLLHFCLTPALITRSLPPHSASLPDSRFAGSPRASLQGAPQKTYLVL